MKQCREFEQLIDRTQTGEATDEERERLLDHMESCVACDDVFEAIGRLRTAEVYPEPTTEELLSMRRAVIREIRRERSRTGLPKNFSLTSLFMRPAFVAGLALLMLSVGYFVGGRGPTSPGISSGNPQISDGSGTDLITTSIQTVAQSHDAYEDIVNSPFTYTNVRLKDGGPGTVHLSFDVARHLELSLPRDHPLVTEVLVQSLIEPSGVDTRLTAISMAQTVSDPKIKKSLIVAMLNDKNLAVRMTAQSKLTEAHGDAEVSAALLTVLEQEPSVQMRLVAIDYLTSSAVQPELLERAITAGEPEGSDAIFVRASQYLNR